MSKWRERVEEEATKIAHEAARPVLRSMYPSRSRGQMANEFKHFYISGAEAERARARKLVEASAKLLQFVTSGADNAFVPGSRAAELQLAAQEVVAAGSAYGRGER